jgi:hypothetical protein
VARREAFVILDGTLMRIDRVAMVSGRDRPYYSGKHKCHGVNMQVITVWVPRTGSPHATCRYSWTSPPSRSRRSTRIPAPGRGGVSAAGPRPRASRAACGVPEVGPGR